jgi:16S rRNA (uracil1498-N3)-methyltransferase
MSDHLPATPAWPPRSAPRLFVVPLSDGAQVNIDGAQAHYLVRVMRIGVAML